MKHKKGRTARTGKATLDNTSIIILSSVVMVMLGIIAYNVYNSTPPSTWISIDEKIPNSKVCMVNDAYMGIDQIEVPVGKKMYYGCCEMCVEKLNTLEGVRFATDPYTGEKVDKADAYIVLKSKSTGEVYYFKSEATHQEFQESIEE